jgi:hypothetical protein
MYFKFEAYNGATLLGSSATRNVLFTRGATGTIQAYTTLAFNDLFTDMGVVVGQTVTIKLKASVSKLDSGGGNAWFCSAFWEGIGTAKTLRIQTSNYGVAGTLIKSA